MDTALAKLAVPLLVAALTVSACAGRELVSEATVTTAASVATQAPQAPSPTTEQSDSAANTRFEGRFFDTSVGTGESNLLFSQAPFADVKELAADSDVVFVGAVVGSSAELAAVRLVTDPGIDDNTTLIYDGLDFRIDQLISGITDRRIVTIGHPVFIRYDEGLARVAVDPIELLRPELEAEEASHQWLVFARTDDQTGLLTISDGRLIRLDMNGLVAAGASGGFEHRLPGTAFETSVDDIDALINRRVPLPTPQTPDMTLKNFLKLECHKGAFCTRRTSTDQTRLATGLTTPRSSPSCSAKMPANRPARNGQPAPPRSVRRRAVKPPARLATATAGCVYFDKTTHRRVSAVGRATAARR